MASSIFVKYPIEITEDNLICIEGKYLFDLLEIPCNSSSLIANE